MLMLYHLVFLYAQSMKLKFNGPTYFIKVLSFQMFEPSLVLVD